MARAKGSEAPNSEVDMELLLCSARCLQRLCRLPEGQRAVQATACSPWGVGCYRQAAHEIVSQEAQAPIVSNLA